MNELNDESQAGDSDEQRQAGEHLIQRLAQELGVSLSLKRMNLPRGGWLELDGYSEEPPIISEAWAHIGPPKSAQKSKVAKDAFKLLLAEKLLNRDFRKILVFADSRAAAHFLGRSWIARGLDAAGIEVKVFELPDRIREMVLGAQRRQFR